MTSYDIVLQAARERTASLRELAEALKDDESPSVRNTVVQGLTKRADCIDAAIKQVTLELEPRVKGN